MTITVSPARNEYTANAGQTIFNYTFKIFQNTDLNVYVTPAGQDANDSTDITTLYTVTGIGDEDGGSITLAIPTNANDLVTIVSNIPSSRTTDYQNNGDFRPNVVNNDFDRVVSLVKKVEDRTNRALLLPESQQDPKPLSLPIPKAGFPVRWNGDASGLENYDNSTVSNEEIASDKVLLNYSALPAAINDTALKINQACIIKERTIGNGGGGVWDVVLASSVTINGLDSVQCVGVPSLALKLRLDDIPSIEQFGAVPGGIVDNTDVFNRISQVANKFSGEAKEYLISGTWNVPTTTHFIAEKGLTLRGILTTEGTGGFPNQMLYMDGVENITFENVNFDFAADGVTYDQGPNLTDISSIYGNLSRRIQFLNCSFTNFVTNLDTLKNGIVQDQFSMATFTECENIYIADVEQSKIREEGFMFYDCIDIQVERWEAHSIGDGVSSWAGFWYCDGVVVRDANFTLTGGSFFNVYSRNVLIENVKGNIDYGINAGRGLDVSNEFNFKNFECFNVIIRNCALKCLRYGLFGGAKSNSQGIRNLLVENNNFDVEEDDEQLAGIRVDSWINNHIVGNTIKLGDASLATIGKCIQLSILDSQPTPRNYEGLYINGNTMIGLNAIGGVINANANVDGFYIENNKWVSQTKGALSSYNGASVFFLIKNISGQVVGQTSFSNIRLSRNSCFNVGGGLIVTAFDDPNYSMGSVELYKNEVFGDTSVQMDRGILIIFTASLNGQLRMERNYIRNGSLVRVIACSKTHINNNMFEWVETANGTLSRIRCTSCEGVIDITDNRMLGVNPSGTDVEEETSGALKIVDVSRNASYTTDLTIVWTSEFTNTALPN